MLELGEIHDRHWSIFGTNANKGKGIQAVFKEVVTYIKLARKEKLQRKADLLKKHNNDLIKKSKDAEIEEKKTQENLDDSADSIKKYSLFENISKSNSVSEDGDEKASEKSDQYDTVFNENTDDLSDVDKKERKSQINQKDTIEPQTTGNINDATETNDEEHGVSETEDKRYSDSDVKVTDLDSDTDESLQDTHTAEKHIEPDEAV